MDAGLRSSAVSGGIVGWLRRFELPYVGGLLRGGPKTPLEDGTRGL